MLTLPGEVSQAVIHHAREGLRAWDGETPIVLASGARLSTIGGLTFRVALSDGPLDGLTFTINVPSLDDLPSWFDYRGERYLRWLGGDGEQGITTAGDPVYRWDGTA